MTTRRGFLESAAFLTLSPAVPAFLPRLAANLTSEADSRILVVIQLDGGNDGLNTVVPFRHDVYLRSRPTLRLAGNRVHRLNDELGLHPSMRAAGDLFQDGRLAIVQGVGYPNPDRSHFGSMAVWHSGGFPVPGQLRDGWLGAALDTEPRPLNDPDIVYVGEAELPRALVGRRAVAVALAREDDLSLREPARQWNAGTTSPADDIAAFARRTVLEAVSASERLAETRTFRNALAYPDSKLAHQLSLVARLIQMHGGTRVYYVAHTGYDTHGTQLQQHAELLATLSQALAAFLNDLRAARLEERVLVMAFSEFGRRVAENASAGTDHGTAGPVFLAGKAVHAGVHGSLPDLTKLENGDPRMTTDFRRVYATVLKDWLGVAPEKTLGGTFAPLPAILK
jgi:uncharacterized protein (DUF1501 family)